METLNQAFRCSFCGKIYLRQKACLKHEQTCTHNPVIKPLCFNCANYRQFLLAHRAETISFTSDKYGLQEKEFYPNTCKAKQCKLFFDYHVKDELKEALLNNGYCEMPSESLGCELFKTII